MFTTVGPLLALGLFASVSSGYSGGSGNVAVYWGQGNAQLSLSEVCSDPSVDIVNLAFVNVFPKEIGDYPGTNFGMDQHLNVRVVANKSCRECVRPGEVPFPFRWRQCVAVKLPEH